jgi:cell division protein FtsW
MTSNLQKYLQGDRVIWTIVILLAFFSIIAVYSSTGMLAYKERGGHTEYYLLKHGTFITGGLMLTWLVSMLPYRLFARFSRIALWIAVPMLAYTLFFGTDINEARRWISIPFISLTFQASDLAKVVLVLFLARQITALQSSEMDLKTLWKPVLIPLLIVCGLIAPANLSTALLLFGASMAMLFTGRIQLKSMLIIAALGAGVFAGLYGVGKLSPSATRANTWASRIESFMDKDNEGYQAQQAKIAIAQGGLFGKGPGHSYQRNVLPSAYSDFIYAIFIEEFGLIGGLLLVVLYLVFFVRCVRLVTRCDRTFASLLVIGMGLLIVLQALTNMAVAVNLGPVTGVTLPFMSMGGTSLFFFSIAAGMILSVSRYVNGQHALQQEQKEASCAS